MIINSYALPQRKVVRTSLKIFLSMMLDRQHGGTDERKKIIKSDTVKLFSRIFNFVPELPPDRVPTLEEATIILGRCHTRLIYIKDLSEYIQNILDRNMPQWPQELWDLKERTEEEINLCVKLIRGIIQQQEEEKAQDEKQKA